MADLAAERIGICGGEPLEAMGEENGVLYGIGKTGSLETPVTGMELARRVKETFGLPFVTVYGEGLWERSWCTGGCLPGLWRQHHPGGPGKRGPSADHRDIGHHAGIDAAAQGLMIIDAGHYGWSIFLWTIWRDT